MNTVETKQKQKQNRAKRCPTNHRVGIYMMKKMLKMFQKKSTIPVPSNTHNAPWLSLSLNSLEVIKFIFFKQSIQSKREFGYIIYQN